MQPLNNQPNINQLYIIGEPDLLLQPIGYFTFFFGPLQQWLSEAIRFPGFQCAASGLPTSSSMLLYFLIVTFQRVGSQALEKDFHGL
jgi:hypothetical protein